MRTPQSDAATMAWPAAIEISEPGGARIRDRANAVLHHLWITLVSLPDRGNDAAPDDVPPEFYRFPGF